MLIVRIHNDGTGTREIGHYDWEVLITETPTRLGLVAHGRLENFPRAHGWRALLREIAHE